MDLSGNRKITLSEHREWRFSAEGAKWGKKCAEKKVPAFTKEENFEGESIIQAL